MIVQGRECVSGIDISNHQRDVDHHAIARDGQSFLVAKATEGIGYTDPWYQRNRDGSKAAGLVFGAYHWLKPHQDVVLQAAHFVRVTGAGQGCDFVMLDAEEKGLTAEIISRWLSLVEGQVKCPIVIYCGAYTDPHVRPTSWRKYAPWLAAYSAGYAVDPDPTKLRAPVPPTPWGYWTIWQYTSSGRVAGVNGNCDVNVADAGWFSQFRNPSAPSALPESEEDNFMATRQFFIADHDQRLIAEVSIAAYGIAAVRTQTVPNGEFSAWFSLHSDEDPQPFPAVEVTAAANADNRAEILVYAKDGKAARKVRNTEGGWKPWAVEG